MFRVDCLEDVTIEKMGLKLPSAPLSKSPFTSTKSSIADNLNIPFPLKLHAMLDGAEVLDFQHIVRWERGGNAFKVHDSATFVETLLPQYFQLNKYKSFQKQLNIYGFTRVARGKDKGLLYHKLFVRGEPSLCAGMQRKSKNSSIAMAEPDSILSFQDEKEDQSISSSSSFYTSSSSDENSEDEQDTIVFDKAFFEGKSFYLVEEGANKAETPVPDAEYSKSSIFTDEEYPAPNKPINNCRNDSFPWKLHDMLDQVEKDGQDDIVSWVHGGRALKVHKPNEFSKKILPLYFLYSKKWESFQRQLNLYGFTRVPRGPKKGMYVHKFFVRDDRSLCRRIARPR